MRKLTILASTALFALAAPAFAESPTLSGQADAGAGVSAGASSGSAGTSGTVGGANAGAGGASATMDSGASGSANSASGSSAAMGQPNFGTVISSINATSETNAELAALQSVPDVNVVQVETLQDVDSPALENAISRNQDDIDTLRSTIESNSIVNAALEAENVEASEIVAAQVDADGSLTVFTKSSS